MKKLYIKQKVFKILDHYPIMDENQEEKYHVDQSFRWMGFRVDVTNALREPVFYIEKEVFTFLPRYHVHFEGGGEYTIQGQFAIFRTHLEIEGLDEQITLKGDIFDLDFQIYADDRLIGEIGREFFTWGDTYELTIHEPGYELFIISLFLCADQIRDDQKGN